MRSSVKSFGNMLRKLGIRKKRTDRAAVRSAHRPLHTEPLEERRLLNGDGLVSLSGMKFEDVNGNGVQDAGEGPLAGVTIYLDVNDNGQLDVPAILEPDDYNSGSRLETVIPEATLSATRSGGVPTIVRSYGHPNAATGTRVIGSEAPNWRPDHTLRIDLAQPALMVSIDFVGDHPSSVGISNGRMEVYDAADNLLDTFLTGPVVRGDVVAMHVARPTEEIAYAIVQSDLSNFLLDNLRIGLEEPSVQTDAGGNYQFTDLPPGDFVVREVVPDGYLRTTVANPPRLFATHAANREILEIDPVDGSELNRFPMPFQNGNPNHGLAYADGTLYFVHDSTDTLYELDANTGAVLDATQLSPGQYDGVAVLDDIVFIADSGPNRITYFDPVVNIPFLTLPVSFDLRGGLGELPETRQLIAGTGGSQIFLIDPDTLAIDSTFGVPGVPQDLGLASINGEIYVGFQDGRIEVRDPSSGSVIRIFRISTVLGALAGQSGDAEAYRVTLGPGESATGLDFGNQYQFGDLSGTKFEDVDGDGVRDAGEPPLAGVTVYVDVNDNGVLELPTVLEPDDYSSGTRLETVIPEATLSATQGGNPTYVRSAGHPNASTGDRVFTSNAPFWTTDRALRIDFAQPESLVSIDVIGDSPSGSRGQMEIYDAADNLLDSVVTPDLARAEVFTMSLTRTAGDIAYAVVQSDFGNHLLDNLAFGEYEPWVATAADGSYEFTDLPTGGYVIREVVPQGYTQTAPASNPTRLFVTDVNPNPDQIVEIDPADGSVLNVLPAPAGSSVNGLAFDGETLYFVSAGPYTLYELDPDTGDVLESTSIQSGRLDGVAALDGLVYILDGYFDRLHVYDPQANTVINTITLNITDPSANPYESLGESDGRLIAGTNSATLAYIDPVTGDVTRAFDIQSGPPDTGLTAFGGEVFVGYFDPNTEIHVYNTDGVLQRTLDVGLRVSGLGGAAGVADDAHRVVLGPSQTITGLDFGNQRSLGEICGMKFEDLDGDGVRDAGEPPLAGVTIYLDVNDDGVFDPGGSVEPDDYAQGTQLNTINPEVTLTAVDGSGNPVSSGLVRSYFSNSASTGSLIIGSSIPPWLSNSRLLRMDFIDPVSTVSIDFVLQTLGTLGKLEVYDAADNLLETYLSPTLSPNEVHTLTVTRPAEDIAYAIASPTDGWGLLDNLRFGEPEPSVVVDATGEYCFTDLPAGDYVIREVVPDGYEQTYPRIGGPQRLFYTPRDGNDIAELDPQTGAEINRFPAPYPTSGHLDGLAFDGQSLWYLNGLGDDVLYQLDPNTGAVIDADAITAGTRNYEGLGALGGSIYILDGPTGEIHEFDPVSDTVTNTLAVGGIRQGLAGITDPDRLVTWQSGQIVEVDPASGAITSSFGGPSGYGFAVVDSEIYIGSNSNPQIWVFNRTGGVVRTFNAPAPSSALGGDNVAGGDGSHRVTLAAGEVVSGLDFGNVPFSPPPEADAGGPYTVPEGGTVTLDGSGSSDFLGGPLTYLWDLDGDGQFGETGPAALRGDEVGVNPVFDASDLNGPRTENVALRVVNQFGKADEDQATVDVTNVAPQIQLIRLSSRDVDEGDTLTVTVEFADPGPGEYYNVTVDFRNGWPTAFVRVDDDSGTATLTSRPYIDDNPSGTPFDTQQIRVTVSDGRESDTVYTDIVVNNVAPTLTNVAVTPSIDENGVATLTGEMIDPAGGSPLQMTGLALVDEMIAGTTDSYAATARIDQADILDRNPTNSWDYDYPVPGGGGDNYAVVGTGTLLVNTAGTFSIAHWGDDGGRLRIDGADVIVDDIQHGPQTIYTDVTLAAGEHAFEWIGWERGGGAGWELSVAVGGGNRSPVRENFGWKVVGDPAPHPEIQLLGPIDVTAYYPMGTTVESFTLEVDWGDGDIETVNLGHDKQFSLTHPYPDDNPSGTPSDDYTINLLVTDDDTGEGTAATSVTVNNVPPTLTDLSATPIFENGVTTLTGTIADVGTLDSFQIEIDWDGDGLVDETHTDLPAGPFSYPHQYLDDDPTGTPVDNMPIGVTVTDDDTGSVTGTTAAEVTNVAPQIMLIRLSELEIDEGETLQLTVEFSDPGTLDTHRVVVGWGTGGPDSVVELTDGSRSATVTSPPYLDDDPSGTPFDPYAIQVTVIDDDTGEDTVTTGITVNNVAPTLTELAASPIFENGVTTLTGTIGDVGVLDTFTIEIDWDGDGLTDETHTDLPAGPFSYPHQYLDDDPTGTPVDDMPINVRVTDDDTGTVSGSTTVEVTNVDPVIVELTSSSPGCGGAAYGDTVTVSGTFTDVGTLDTHTAVIDWGDGTAGPMVVTEAGGAGTVTGSHVYDDGGVYTVTVTLTDDDTGTTTETTTTVIVGVGINDGVLQIVGTPDDDHVTVNQQGNGLMKVHADFLHDANFKTVDADDVDLIYAVLCGGDDHLTIGGSVDKPALIDGGPGNDHLNAGNVGSVLLGGSGNDLLIGGSGNDVLFGGRGEDQLIGGPGQDILMGDESVYDSDPGAGELIDDEALLAIRDVWNSADDFQTRQDDLAPWLNDDTLSDDNNEDVLNGSSDEDWLLAFGDRIVNGGGSKSGKAPSK